MINAVKGAFHGKWNRVVDFFIVACIIIAAVAYIGRAPDDGGRVVLCTGIIANTANVARDDPNVVRICREVGVDRADYPDTP
jgi:hypothetical protein